MYRIVRYVTRIMYSAVHNRLQHISLKKPNTLGKNCTSRFIRIRYPDKCWMRPFSTQFSICFGFQKVVLSLQELPSWSKSVSGCMGKSQVCGCTYVNSESITWFTRLNSKILFHWVIVIFISICNSTNSKMTKASN